MATDWTQLFPDADYRFQMGLRKGEPAAFYAPTAEREAILGQRRRWLRDTLHECVALQPDGIGLLDEAIELAFGWRSISEAEYATLKSLGSSSTTEGDALSSPGHKCRELATCWEPDFLLLRPDEVGRFHLVGGAVCFPSSWALPEKVGLPLPEIHGVVPGLNVSLERSIQNFLARLSPGVSWERENWGLSRTPEWNMNPRRDLPRLQPPLTLDEIWLRVEHQSFVSLPKTRGVLFGIRLQVESLGPVARDGDTAKRLARALQTMPEEMARYKGLAEARADLIKLLS